MQEGFHKGGFNLYLHPHLGLGDAFHINGIVRTFVESKKWSTIFLFTSVKYQEQVDWMFRDLPEVTTIPIESRQDADKVAESHCPPSEYMMVGYSNYGVNCPTGPDGRCELPWTCDEKFYRQLNIPYDVRFDKCWWERDKGREQAAYDALAGGRKEYIFVHDAPELDFNIDMTKVRSDLPIIRNDVSRPVFDMCMLIENATEVHVMESSVRCMMESLNLEGVDLYYHSIRGGLTKNADGSIRGTQLNWNYID